MTQSQPYRTEGEWVKSFIDLNAYWRHSGNPEQPHALLTKGGHSDGFFNWTIVSEHPLLVRRTSVDLLRNLEPFHVRNVQRVIGPGYGAITLAHGLAEALWRKNPNCVSGFTEKMPDGSMSVERYAVAGQNVITCEDTITSGASVSATIAAIERSGGNVLPFVLCICNLREWRWLAIERSSPSSTLRCTTGKPRNVPSAKKVLKLSGRKGQQLEFA